MRALFVVGALALLSLSSAVLAQDTELDPVKPALLVIDIQNKYIPMMDQRDQDSAMRYIDGAIWLFRKFDFPVVHVYHTDPRWGPEPGTEDFEFPDSVDIQETDAKVTKNYPSAFVKTDLDAILEEKEVNTVFLCGLSATGCVLATYYGALERDYNVFMVEGALMSDDAEHTETIKDIVDSVTWGGLEVILRATKL